MNILREEVDMGAVTPRPVALVVDDEPLLTIVAMNIADDLGFSAISASNADEALSILEKRDDIRLVLTDVNMPGSLDGIALARTVRNRWPPIKLLVVSGRPLPDPASLPAGAMFLAKPFGVSDIDGMVRQLFA